MRDYQKVAEGILECDEESLEENLSSPRSVQLYADSMDITLDDDVAQKILEVCSAWVEGTKSGKLNGTNDYYYTVTQPLDQLED
tara:strand:+ start:685 stop:936 length:252 start_codon:yes stop_codon:yes gene_type:complete